MYVCLCVCCPRRVQKTPPRFPLWRWFAPTRSGCCAPRLGAHLAARTNIHTHKYTHTHTQTYIHTNIRTHTNIHTHKYTHTHTNTHTHKYTHTHTNIHTHKYIHTHTIIHTHTLTYVKFPKGKSFDYYVLKEKVLKICFNVSMLIRWYLDFCFCRALPPWLSVGD